MFDFDVITGPTSSRPLAPAATSPQPRGVRAAEERPAERSLALPGRPEEPVSAVPR
jgi:hypothetical protein